MSLTGLFEDQSACTLFFLRNSVTNPRVRRYIYIDGN